jgi:hypothetical protein
MRLVTRGDLDGLSSAVLVTSMEQIDSIELVHPKDMQDGKVAVTKDDIIVNLPYHPKCAKWFDHHFGSEAVDVPPKFDGRYGVAPSASRLVFEYYNSPGLDRFGELVSETDRVDAAQLTMEDIVDPKRYVLLSYTLDPRTGLGGSFRSYYMHLLNWIKVHPINDVLAMPEVAEKVDEIRSSQKAFEKELLKHSSLDENVVTTDFRRKQKRPVGNRFLIYALYPTSNVWMNLFRGRDESVVVIALGHSILNRTCNTNIGELCASYGGGGHKGAGTCQVDKSKARKIITEIVGKLKANG